MSYCQLGNEIRAREMLKNSAILFIYCSNILYFTKTLNFDVKVFARLVYVNFLWSGVFYFCPLVSFTLVTLTASNEQKYQRHSLFFLNHLAACLHIHACVQRE